MLTKKKVFEKTKVRMFQVPDPEQHAISQFQIVIDQEDDKKRSLFIPTSDNRALIDEIASALAYIRERSEASEKPATKRGSKGRKTSVAAKG